VNNRKETSKNTRERDRRRAEAIRFGELVREYQDKWGLRNTDLARLIFGDESSSSRVADLKAGRNNPGSDIRAAVRDALEIPQGKIDACRSPIAAELSEDDRDRIDLSRELLESLALRFEHTNPDASTPELIRFLKQKAVEFKQLQLRLKSLIEIDARLDIELKQSELAIDRGEFEIADQLLEKLEEFQQSKRTLAQVRKQASIRQTRAEAALLNEDIGAALQHFTVCAGYFDPFDRIEGAKSRDEAAQRLLEHGFFYGGASHAAAIKLWELNLTVLSVGEFADERAQTLFSLGFAKMELGMRASPSLAKRMLYEAIEHYSQSTEISVKNGPSAYGARTFSNMGIAYKELAIRESGEVTAELLRFAIKFNTDAVDYFAKNNLPLEWTNGKCVPASSNIQDRGFRRFD